MTQSRSKFNQPTHLAATEAHIISGNAPSNDEETMSSQTPQEESGATALQNEADPTQGQRPQDPSEDELSYMVKNLDLLQAAVKSGLNGYIYLLLVRRLTRPSTPIPSEISVDQLSTQQILDLRRILEHDIREADHLTNLRECYTRHYRRLAEGEQALRSAKGIMQDTQEYAAAQPGRTDGEGRGRSNSSEAAEEIWGAVWQKLQAVVERYGDETRETRWSMYVTDPGSAYANMREEDSRLLRTKELSTLSGFEIAGLRIMVDYDTRLALELTSLRVSSLKAVDALETVCRDNERNISRLM
ncbi:MAG: hypothetical protein AUREO_056650 [Aureobasidium pullulans]|nr:MAG: hypothetical protein AUREO_056650 [Aureobasidium pullulans]